MNLNDIYEELLEACSTIDGIETYGVMSESINTPAIVPGPFDIVEYDQTYGGALNKAELRFYIVASKTSIEDGISLINELASFDVTRSVKKAIEGGTYTALSKPRVLRAENAGAMQYGAVVYLACELVVEVYASK